MPTRSLDPTAPGAPAGTASSRALPSAGGQFGPYRIVRLLGRGGMGEVHEAEEIASGRRVALKVLNRTLGEHDRARFLREGRLAASLSHPHTVYVYGTDEIAGVPVIAMELATGGTLKDRVVASGPLPPREAVDLARQIIAGLDAAARAGVLHRDVKPSNCFLDRDGRVKVGDFGLSISTAIADETHLTLAGTVLGTPAFASPEQLRGGALDVASDIYSVGATLYYLLTGRAPFEDGNLVTLVARVLQDPPTPPGEVRAGIPRDLSAVVLRALAKASADRFESYAAFDAALRPFSSEAPVPASPGPRFIAAVVDVVVVNVLMLPLQIGALASGALQSRWGVLGAWLLSFTAYLIYYAALEGRWGASIGKRLTGLQVIAVSGDRAGFRAVVIRTVVFLAAMQLPQLLVPLVAGPEIFLQPRQGLAAVGVQLVTPTLLALGLILLFGRARPSNGWTGLHDAGSSTRVIVRPPLTSRAARRTAVATMPATVPTTRLGPYSVVAGSTLAPGAIVSGIDGALHRPVWIRIAAPGEPPIAAERRDLDRPARLRWLAGHRSADGGWDAFEAPGGVPLTAAPPVSTDEWRRFLLPLAAELDAGARHDDLPTLSLARVWIGEHGDVRLLDFQAPGAAEDSDADAAVADWQRFLHEVALRLLTGGRPAAELPAPPPLHVSSFVDRLAAGAFGAPALAAAELAAIGDRPVVVSRARRAGPLAQMAAVPAFILIAFLAFLVAVNRLSGAYPGLELMRDIGERLEELERSAPAASASARAEREALEVLVAGRYAARLRDPEFRSGFFPRAFVLEEHGARLDRAAAAHPDVTPAELAAAEAELSEFLARGERSSARLQSARGLAMVLPVLAALAWLAVAAPTLAFAPILRGGLTLRLWGIAVVDRSGREISRLRALGRALLAWAPVAVLVLLAAAGRWQSGPLDRSPWFLTSALLLTAVFLAGAGVAILTPSRGLQDRLAGTWLVPR